MNTEKQPYRIIISGGGTGGHIFPAIAIANRIKEVVKDADILFVGALGKMEMQKVPEAGYKIIGLPVTGLQRRLTVKNLTFPFKVMSSIMKARKIVREFQPHVAIGVGGYASGPTLRAAGNLKVPSLIQEQNSYAGLTNKWLGKKANRICVAYEDMHKYFPKDKLKLTGNPVRKDMTDIQGKSEKALSFFKLDPAKKTLFVMGGSLGARTINNSLLGDIEKILNKDIQVIWQVGRFYIDDIKKKLEDVDQTNLRVFEFIREMDLAYAAADLVISRAGALSISELCIVKKPVIFVPSPNVSEDHQTKNAMALVKRDAAAIIPDQQAQERLVDRALELINDSERCALFSNNISKMARPKATEDIVNEILKLIE